MKLPWQRNIRVAMAEAQRLRRSVLFYFTSPSYRNHHELLDRHSPSHEEVLRFIVCTYIAIHADVARDPE